MLLQRGFRWLLLALLTGCVAEPTFGGPLPVRNGHPAQMTVLHLPSAGASVLPAGTLDVAASAAYSSLFLSSAGNGNSFAMDGEFLRVEPSLRVGLGRGIEVGVALPLAHASGGFLDGFLIDYHEALGFPDSGRSTAPRNGFRIAATEQGRTVFAVEPHGIELFDVPIWFGWTLADPARGTGVALRGGIELPTGNRDRGYGNGGLDAALGVAVERRFGRFALSGQIQHTFAGNGSTPPGSSFRFADVTAAELAIELPLAERLSALAQLGLETSTLRRLAVPAAERDHLLLWIGGRYRLDRRASIELAFGEDLNRSVSPDFTAWLGFDYGPW